MAEAFTWGAGGAKLTPEQLALARALLNRKKSQGVDTSPVGHWTAGAARVVDALGDVVQERRLNNQQAENDQYNVAQTEPLIAALSGGGTAPVSAPASGGVSDNTAAIAAASGVLPSSFLAAVDKTEGGGTYDTLYGHAQKSGPFAGTSISSMPIRDVLAFTDPSGAYAQSVKGQIGRVATPVGRYQVVGSTLKNAVGALGLDPNAPFDQSAQDNVALYLAKNRVSSANTPQGKIAALRNEWHGFKSVPDSEMLKIVSDLESAPTSSRAPVATPAAQAIEQAAPSSGYVDPMVSVQPNAMAPELPAPVEVSTRTVASPPIAHAPQQSSPSPSVLAQALRVMADPRANENTKAVAQALIQRQQAQEQAAQEQSIWQQRQAYQAQQQASDPLRQLQIQKAQAEVAQMQDPNANVPDAVKSLDLRAQRAGLQPGSPEYNNFFITQGVKPPANVGAPPAGYQIVYDASGNPTSMAPIPGSPAAMEAEAQKKVLANQQSGKSTSSDVITNAARLARETLQAPGLPATGMIGGALSGLPETNAAELRRQVGVLTSNATVENLNAMRAASPTGGALGSVTEKEGAMLAAKSGALDPNSPNFARDLEDYERTLLRVVHGQAKGDEIFNQTRKPVSDDIRAAQDAIAKGAPREMVIKRLQDAGIDTEGL